MSAELFQAREGKLLTWSNVSMTLVRIRTAQKHRICVIFN